MALPKNKKNKKNRRLNRHLFRLVLLVFYAGLFAAAVYLVVFNAGRQAAGQLSPGETVTLPGFSRSLDLRVASKNKYPSDQISIVQDLGVVGQVVEKVFSFKVEADGLNEYGLMALPSSPAPSGGFPIIILSHGYDNPEKYSTIDDLQPDMEFYAQRGFAVLKPDFRGQGLSINQGHADSAYYSMSYNTDIMSLISAVKKTQYLNKNKLNLIGFSMGSYISLRAAVLTPDVKNLILMSGPVDSLQTMYLTYIPPSDVNNLYALKSRNDDFAKYGNPAENSAFWSAASPINFVSRLKGHVQIHVGALDQIVPTQFSADLDSALTKAHVAHDYFVYPDGNHSLEAQRGLIRLRTLQILQPPAPTQAA